MLSKNDPSGAPAVGETCRAGEDRGTDVEGGPVALVGNLGEGCKIQQFQHVNQYEHEDV